MVKVPNKYRESKYLNESGTKNGRWFLNRLDYFQFHEYPSYKKHKMISLFVFIIAFYMMIKLMSISLLVSCIFIYVAYISLRTFYVLHSKICRYDGYFLYPTSVIKFFKSIEVEVDVNDFDAVATMHKD